MPALRLAFLVILLPAAIYFTRLIGSASSPTEISFSIWFFFLLYKLEGLLLPPDAAAAPSLYPQSRASAPSVPGSARLGRAAPSAVPSRTLAASTR
jgi:hypothetical protein